MVAPAGWSRFSGLRAPFSGALRPWHGLNCSTARQAGSVKMSGFSPTRGSPLTHCTLTETLGGPVTPLGIARLTVMAGEDSTTRQHKPLVTDILHSCSHRKLGTGYEASAVLHIPWVMAGCHCRWRDKAGQAQVWGYSSVNRGTSEECRNPWI